MSATLKGWCRCRQHWRVGAVVGKVGANVGNTEGLGQLSARLGQMLATLKGGTDFGKIGGLE